MSNIIRRLNRKAIPRLFRGFEILGVHVTPAVYDPPVSPSNGLSDDLYPNPGSSPAVSAIVLVIGYRGSHVKFPKRINDV